MKGYIVFFGFLCTDDLGLVCVNVGLKVINVELKVYANARFAIAP